MLDTKEISPWELLDSVRNSGPLMLSWFGAVRMKRKPLKYDEQRKLIRFHTHQNYLQASMNRMHSVSLPDLTPIPEEDKSPEESAKPSTETASQEKASDALQQQQPQAKQPAATPGIQTGPVPPVRMPLGPQRATMPDGVTGSPFHQPMIRHPGFVNQPGYRAMYAPQQQPSALPSHMAIKLKEIKSMNEPTWQTQHGMSTQMAYASHQQHAHAHAQQPFTMGATQQQLGMMQRPAAYNPQYQARLRHLQMLQRMPMEQRIRIRQLQQQRAAMLVSQQQQMGQYNPQMQYRQIPAGMRPLPMQANPPVPMQQVMQQTYAPGAPQPQMMVRAPQVQQQMQYTQQPQRMNPMHPPMF